MREDQLRLLQLMMDKFETETAYHSQIQTNHPYFQMVIMWGKEKPTEIIPILLQRMYKDWAWCLALREIVEEKNHPHIPAKYTGMNEIVTIWRRWGEEKGFIVWEF